MYRLRSMLALLILLIATMAWGYPRTVLLEDFTSTTCSPCAGSWAILGPMIEDDYTTEELSVIVYHMNWPTPGNDPWYAANPDENFSRRSYYSVNSVPDIFIDGVLGPNTHDESAIANAISQRAVIESSLDMDLAAWYDGTDINVELAVTSDEGIASAKLHLVLCETYVLWNSPAPNGMTAFHYPMVDMEPNGNGQTFEISANTTNDYEATFPMNDDWDITNITVVAFVQQNGTSEVLQSTNAAIDINVPMLVYDSVEFLDEDDLRPNGRPDAGENVDMVITLRDLEQYQPASGITGTLSCDDPELSLTENVASWPDLQPGDTGSNAGTEFGVVIPEDYVPKYVTFTVSATDNADHAWEIAFEVLIGVPDIRLVNDIGDTTDYSDDWQAMFDSLGFIADVGPDINIPLALDQYSTVIWTTGIDSDPTTVITADEAQAIQNFLDAGGKLILTSQYAGEVVGSETWFQQYFAATHALDAMEGQSAMGLEGVYTGGFAGQLLLVGAGGASNSVSPSTMTAGEEGISLFTYLGVQDIAGVGHETDSYSAIYLGFPVEAVSGGGGTTKRHELLAGLLDWVNGNWSDADEIKPEKTLPVSMTLNGYPNPFNPDLTIDFTVPVSSQATLEVFNVLGQRVALLHQGQLQAGYHSITWNATDMPSGMYLVRLQQGSSSRIMRTMLLK